jgi:hypothetical protein
MPCQCGHPQQRGLAAHNHAPAAAARASASSSAVGGADRTMLDTPRGSQATLEIMAASWS